MTEESIRSVYLDQIPNDWQKTRLGELVEKKSIRYKDVDGNSDLVVCSVTNEEGFVRSDDNFDKKVYSDEVDDYKIVYPGEFAFNPSRINVGSIAILDKNYPALISPMYEVFASNDRVKDEYLRAFLQSDWALALFDAHSQGSVRETLKFKLFKQIPIPLPPEQEQELIAENISNLNKLDKTSQELIDLYDDLKTAILQDELSAKDTTEERLGPKQIEIPQHWEIKEITDLVKSTSKSIRGGPPGGRIKTDDRVADGYKIFLQEHVIKRDFTRRNDYISQSKFNDLKSASPIPGDVLVTRRGTIGRSAVFPKDAPEGIISDSLIRIRIDESEILPEYLSEMIDLSPIVDMQIQSMSQGSGRQGLNNKIIGDLKIPLPPLSEQRQIIKRLSLISEQKSILKSNKKESVGLKKGIEQRLLNGRMRCL